MFLFRVSRDVAETSTLASVANRKHWPQTYMRVLSCSCINAHTLKMCDTAINASGVKEKTKKKGREKRHSYSIYIYIGCELNGMMRYSTK